MAGGAVLVVYMGWQTILTPLYPIFVYKPVDLLYFS